MELNLSELDNVNTMNPYEKFDYNSYEENGLNYWETSNKKNTETKTKKKKVSFNDILSNMNLVVNQQGVLQFMGPKQEEEQMYQHQPNYTPHQPNYSQQQPNYSQQQPNYSQQQPNYTTNIKKVKYQQGYQVPPENKNQEPLDPAVKHSYIYNKYFKDYIDPVENKPAPRVPKTIEEYRQMLLEDRIRAIQHKQRIEQIKSKKMLFVTTPGSHINPRNIQATKNNLRSMNFR
jgi:hypothetical protein